MREHIETAACEANCECVWRLPEGFDVHSGDILYHWITSILQSLTVGRLSLSGG